MALPLRGRRYRVSTSAPGNVMPNRAWIVAVCVLLAGCERPSPAPQSSTATLFEGALLIDGHGGAPIERSAFLVDGDAIVQVGRAGDVAAPDGARRVDLTGKTVIP